MVDGSITVQAENNDDRVDFGDGRVVSMQTVQHIYHELTGKKEELTSFYHQNHKAGIQDLTHLNTKIVQTCEQYNICGANCSVIVYFVNDQKMTFSSFSRFAAFDRSSPSAVERITMKYSFLIVLPNNDTPQSYEIQIDLTSRAAIMSQQNTFEPGPGIFFGYLVASTGSLSIHYVDYLVARTFKQIIDDWFDTLPTIEKNKTIDFLRKQSRHFSFTFRLATALVFLAACYMSFYGNVPDDAFTFKGLFRAGLISFGGVFLITMTATKLASIAIDAARKAQPMSYIDLTRGDDIAFKKLQKSNKKSAIKISVAVVGTILLNVISAWVTLGIGIGAT